VGVVLELDTPYMTLEQLEAHPESDIPIGKLAEMYHEHPLLPPGRLPNGCWTCIGCGKIVGKKGRWINWCSDCGYDWYDG
jgi:hypothetical protein